MLCVVDGNPHGETVPSQTGTLEQLDSGSNELLRGVTETTAYAAVETILADGRSWRFRFAGRRIGGSRGQRGRGFEGLDPSGDGLEGDGAWHGRQQGRNVDALDEVDLLVVGDDGGDGGRTGQGGGEHVGDGAALKVDAAGEVHVVGELDLEVEAVDALVQTAVAAQDRLVLEQGSEAIAKVLAGLLASSLGAADAVRVDRPRRA
jgi:hypothetical protein